GVQTCALPISEGRPADPAQTDSFNPTVFLYDNYSGGIGLSEPLFRLAPQLVREAIELVQGCECTSGCPACVGPVPGNELPGKASARELAAGVLALFGA